MDHESYLTCSQDPAASPYPNIQINLVYIPTPKIQFIFIIIIIIIMSYWRSYIELRMR
jgi:hypothetical protein